MGSWIAACGVEVDPEDVIPFSHEGMDYAIYRSPGDEYYAPTGTARTGRRSGRRYWRTFGPTRSR
jgi:hypothetical protein